MRNLFIKIALAIMIFTLSLSFVGCSLFETPQTGEQSPQPDLSQVFNEAKFGRIEGERVKKDKVDVIESVERSVVSIMMQSPSGGVSAGSGVIVDISLLNDQNQLIDGANVFYILTCHHVIDGKGEIEVYLPDAESDNFGEKDYDESYIFTGTIGDQIYQDKQVTLVGGDQKSDVALLKLVIEDNDIANGVVKAKFPPSSDYQMKKGEEVIAIGNPSGTLPGTVSVGTISYVNRETTTEVGEQTLIQINTDIYHGSSGGALFNTYGELIGITNAGREGYVIESESSNDSIVEYGGLCFAIPYVVDSLDDANDYGFMNVAKQLILTKTATNYGYVTGRVGIFGITVGQNQGGSVVITDVIANSIAANAGLMADDVIVKINGSDVTNISQVNAVFKNLKAGDTVALRVMRVGVGYKDISMTGSQYIFCDTGN